MGLNLNKNVAKEEVKVEATPVEKEAVAEEVTAPGFDEGILGSARKDLAFVCPLGDPSNEDTTTVIVDGIKTKKVTSTIIGYKFKLLADMRIPDCGLNEGFKKDAMNFVKVEAWKEGKKDEVVMLSPYETALLLSQPQFNGGCDGGEVPVNCSYNLKGVKTKDGKVATVTGVQAIPRVVVKAASGSIKDHGIEDVLTYETVKRPNGTTRKIRTMKKGYEKFAPLAMESVRKSASGASAGAAKADPTKVANANAQAFLSIVAKRARSEQK